MSKTYTLTITKERDETLRTAFGYAIAEIEHLVEVDPIKKLGALKTLRGMIEISEECKQKVKNLNWK